MTEPVKEKCTTCDGTGEVHSHNPRCWSCGGRGYFIRRYENAGSPIESIEDLRDSHMSHFMRKLEDRLLAEVFYGRQWRLFREDVARTPEADLPSVAREAPTRKTRRTLAYIDALLELKGYEHDEIHHYQIIEDFHVRQT